MGSSYQVLGVHKLAGMKEWRGFMESAKEKALSSLTDKKGYQPDVKFIGSSLARGFSTLRVHEIPVTGAIEGEFPPRIVGLVDSI